MKLTEQIKENGLLLLLNCSIVLWMNLYQGWMQELQQYNCDEECTKFCKHSPCHMDVRGYIINRRSPILILQIYIEKKSSLFQFVCFSHSPAVGFMSLNVVPKKKGLGIPRIPRYSISWRYLIFNPLGSESFVFLCVSKCCTHGQCAIIMFDVTSWLTWKIVPSWHHDHCSLVNLPIIFCPLNSLIAICPSDPSFLLSSYRVSQDTPILLCGNKVDAKNKQFKTRKVSFHRN